MTRRGNENTGKEMPDTRAGLTAYDRRPSTASRAIPTANALLTRLRERLPPPARSPTALPDSAAGETWLEYVMKQVDLATQTAPARRRTRRLIPIKTILAVAVVALGAKTYWPDIRGAYEAAYPADPGQEEALAWCSRGNPAFLRLRISDRDECYARYASLHDGRQAAIQWDLHPTPLDPSTNGVALRQHGVNPFIPVNQLGYSQIHR